MFCSIRSLLVLGSSPMLHAALNRSGPISPCSNGATKMPSGRSKSEMPAFEQGVTFQYGVATGLPKLKRQTRPVVAVCTFFWMRIAAAAGNPVAVSTIGRSLD